MKKFLPFLIGLAMAPLCSAGTAGIHFVHQILFPIGTEGDSEMIFVKTPVICNAVPEGAISYISAKTKLLQRENAFAEDSNLLSLLNISVRGEWNSNAKCYMANLDLSGMKPASTFELTEEQIVEAAIKCIRDTIPEIGGGESVWKIHVIPHTPGDLKWAKYDSEYQPPVIK